ncbi:unnamed protein product [Tetraodon nigroviridis]|uniref:(spotted green pufferfish) hypothetical protein n=1 Tax=Tetraodon nigroviridis TaxID=99883 RepID=Q4RFJ7_TETNG|nr:unnamed protein product [Tetraodon nigroviridis]
MMLLSGLNFLPDSKVVFVEKAQDGHHLWETEAKVDKTSIKSGAIVVEIPPYRNQRISNPVHVNFYVCNGKRKRSQYQRFTYLPLNVPIIKTEPNDEYDSLGSARVPMHSKPFYSQPRLSPILPVADHDACLIGGYSPCPPCHVTLPPTPPSSSPTLQDLSPVAYSKCLPSSPSHTAPPGPIMSHIQESPGCPSLPHPPSPDHNSPMGMLQSQGSPNHLNSPGTQGYHAIYANSSPSSSPISHPSTPGATAESPLVQAYSPAQAQAAAGSPGLLHEDASPPPMAITVKQEPQELDQMYLDDAGGRRFGVFKSVLDLPQEYSTSHAPMLRPLDSHQAEEMCLSVQTQILLSPREITQLICGELPYHMELERMQGCSKPSRESPSGVASEGISRLSSWKLLHNLASCPDPRTLQNS